MLHRLFLILSFLCLLLSQYKLVTVKSEKQVVAHAQAQLNRLETEIQQSLDSIATFQTQDQFHEYFIHRGLQNQGFSFFYLAKGQLLYWSDNETTLSNPDTINDKTLLRLSNGLYEAFVKQHGNKKIIGLLLLKKDYAYENKYLVNDFNSKLGLGENVVLSESTSAFPINSIYGKKIISVSFSQEATTETTFDLQAWSYLLAYLFFIIGIVFYALSPIAPRFQFILLLSFLLIVIRLAMVTFHVPYALYHTNFFNPRFYASSFLFNSIGDFFFNSFTFYCVAVIINRIKTRFTRTVFSIIIFYGLLILLAIFIHQLIVGLILNSKIVFDVSNIPDLNLNSLAGLLSIMFLLWGYLLLVKVAPSPEAFSKLSDKYSSGGILPIKLAASETRILILLLFSFYTSFVIIHYSKIKERDNRKLFAQQLDTRRDHLSEYLFEDVAKLVAGDTTVMNIFRQKQKVTEAVSKRLQQIYFNGYWSKFNISTWCFGENDQPEAPLISSPQLQDFRMEVQARGHETYSDKLFFLQNETGRLNYLSILPLRGEKDSTIKVGTIVLRLDGRIIQRTEGFPELFVSDRISPEVKVSQPNYSFARYLNDSLIYTYGSYSYPFSSSVIVEEAKKYSSDENGFKFFSFDRIEHLIYESSPASLIIVSYPEESLFNVVSLFSYVLLFFSLFYFITVRVTSLAKSRNEAPLTLKQRIRASIVVLVVLSFVLIATGTIIYLIQKYDKDQNQNILNRLNSLWFALYDNFTFQSNLSALNYEEWSPQLNRLADNLNMDFNLYDEAGNMFYSSQSKIFDQGIVSTRMNPEAFFDLDKYSRTQYVHPENAGQLKYIAAYAPFTNQNGNITGYVNLPYFEKQNELKKEISGFLSTLINIYVLLLVIAIFLALFISSRITQPLLLIQKKLRTIREESSGFNVGSSGVNNNPKTLYTKLEWNREDEIGELVQEYNRMVAELETSAEKLARSERESAWREMAQQVAHEIKNPLTPMKLSVQHLQLAWNEKRENIDELFNRISKTLIEQINTLSNIATEFSNFANMPKAKKEFLKLEDVVQSSIHLFENTPHIKIEYHNSINNLSGKIFSDKEQLTRVFSNLIKNAIQSIDSNKEGVINIRTKIEGEQYLVEIRDSGSGIPAELQPKIFTPYFTTKNSGMGLGLSMVKNIVEEMGGSIRFESKEGQGTIFFVTLLAAD